MSSIKIHAGDFKGKAEISHWHSAIHILSTKKHPFLGEKIPFAEIESIEIATEESVKKIGGTLGWGVTGAVLLGPVGLLAGLLAGGRGKKVTFVTKFKDGRKILASTNIKTFNKLQAATF